MKSESLFAQIKVNVRGQRELPDSINYAFPLKTVVLLLCTTCLECTL